MEPYPSNESDGRNEVFSRPLSYRSDYRSEQSSASSQSPMVKIRSFQPMQKPAARNPTLLGGRPNLINVNKKPGQKQASSSTQSAPMLPVLQSPLNTSFYTKSSSHRGSDSMQTASSFGSSRVGSRPPLGGAWREQERGGELRSNIDEGKEFIQGCIPNWSSENNIRSSAAVEHKLTWAYYHMRGMRTSLGQTEQTTSSKKNGQFNFWRDLRPPFRVKRIQREVDDGHADGPLFNITYCCPLDYVTERKWGHRTAEGSFENLVHGVAEVRIPKDFPQISKHVIVLSWGKPEIKFGSKPKLDDKEAQAVTVDPKKWSPIAAEFHMRSNCTRLAKIRESLHETNLKMAVQGNQMKQMRPWQKALLKPSATLSDFVKAEKEMQEAKDAEGTESPKRELRMRTACVGFVDIHG